MQNAHELMQSGVRSHSGGGKRKLDAEYYV